MASSGRIESMRSIPLIRKTALTLAVEVDQHHELALSGQAQRRRMRVRRVVLGLGLGLLLGVLFPLPSRADEVRWLSVGVRGGASMMGHAVLGRSEDESFQQYDVVGTLGLPWSFYAESGWGVKMQVMTSLGALTGGGNTAFLTTAVPGLAFGPRDSLLALDIGVGASLLSQNQFGQQNMGGSFHVVFTTGLRIPVYEGVGVGYRFHHMSDANLYGPGVKGVDTHLLEMTYSFR
jgi:Lipid A 3-O-deacylase (PagL)